MSLKSNDARTRVKCRREFVKVETSRLLRQEAEPVMGTCRVMMFSFHWSEVKI